MNKLWYLLNFWDGVSIQQQQGFSWVTTHSKRQHNNHDSRAFEKATTTNICSFLYDWKNGGSIMFTQKPKSYLCRYQILGIYSLDFYTKIFHKKSKVEAQMIPQTKIIRFQTSYQKSKCTSKEMTPMDQDQPRYNCLVTLTLMGKEQFQLLCCLSSDIKRGTTVKVTKVDQ